MYLDYRLSEDWDENSSDLAAADETELRYYAATGESLSKNDQADLSARWGWIPLIDFALALRKIAATLTIEEGRETFEFTESDATLRFDRHGHGITITGSYAAGEITFLSRYSLIRRRILLDAWMPSWWPNALSSN